MTTDQQLPRYPIAERRTGRLASEVMAAARWSRRATTSSSAARGLVGVIGVVALIGVLGLFNIWWLVFVVGVLIAIFLHELGLRHGPSTTA